MKLNHGSARRKGFTPPQREQLLEEFERDPVSALEFAAQHGLGVSTLYHWRRRCRPAPRVASGKTAPTHGAFQQVSLADVFGGGHWAGEVRLPDGTELRWNNQASTTVLQNLLGDLRRPC